MCSDVAGCLFLTPVGRSRGYFIDNLLLSQVSVVHLSLTVAYRFLLTPLLSGALLFIPVTICGAVATEAAPRLAENQNQAQQLFRQGQLQHSKGNLEAAIEHYTEAIKLDPDLVVAYVARGGAMGVLENYPAAIADYTTAINLSPNLAGAYGGRGLARFRNGQENAGIDDLWQAAQLYRAQNKMNDYFRTLGVIQRLAP
jgi:tetratricopeptide (TPR) repeat protein